MPHIATSADAELLEQLQAIWEAQLDEVATLRAELTLVRVSQDSLRVNRDSLQQVMSPVGPGHSVSIGELLADMLAEDRPPASEWLTPVTLTFAGNRTREDFKDDVHFLGSDSEVHLNHDYDGTSPPYVNISRRGRSPRYQLRMSDIRFIPRLSPQFFAAATVSSPEVAGFAQIDGAFADNMPVTVTVQPDTGDVAYYSIGAGDSGTAEEVWQWDFVTTSAGPIIPLRSVHAKYRSDGAITLLVLTEVRDIVVNDDVEDHFAIAVPAGTRISDYRGTPGYFRPLIVDAPTVDVLSWVDEAEASRPEELHGDANSTALILLINLAVLSGLGAYAVFRTRRTARAD